LSVKANSLAALKRRAAKAAGRLAASTLWRLIACGLLPAALLASSATAQPLSNLVFTVGTTYENTNAYVLLGAPDPRLLAGKRFAIFGKNGYPTNSGAFTLRGTIFQQTDTAAINTLLTQSVSLGDDLTALDNALAVLLHNVPGATNETLPQKVLTAFQTAPSDPGLASALLILERMHPGLTRCAGQAFSEVLATTTTYEVREADPNTGAAGDVVGRVTIAPGQPVILPAPGFPYQVVSNSPIDHLRIRLRWGTPDALRRLSLLQFGFNVWRLPAATAVNEGFDVTPPTPAQLHAPANGFTLVNSAPVMATKDYAPLAGPGGPDDPTDFTTYFFVDSNGRSQGSAQFPTGKTPPGYLTPAFSDGDHFYYFITARDVLGQDGAVSLGGPATACRKDLPAAPGKLSVLNSVQFVALGGGASTNEQRLLVRWQQNTDTNDLVSQYWIYRWPNPTMALTNEMTPSNHVIGVVPQMAGATMNSLMDTNITDPGPSNYWYTVRSVSASACGQLLFSPNSAPVSGVLRQHAAPPAPSGELVGSCGTPVVMFQQFDPAANPNGPDTNLWHYRVTVTRRDAGIAWALVVLGNNSLQTTQSFGPLYFPPDGDSLSVDFALPASSGNSEFDASCVVGTYYGEVSQTAYCETTNAPSPSQITEAVFAAGELLFTALSSSDPFYQAVNINQSSCQTALNPSRDASGTVHMRFDVGPGQPMMIQYATNENGNEVWTDVGVATPDTNGVYSIYLCPCVISPLPPLRGCTVNLPNDGNCDQHIARAGRSGPIAPIRARFRLTPRTHEYRLYRSVDGAPPTLIAQGEALFDPANPNNEIVRDDDTMPPSAGRLCYFVQALDENGNGSPLALIGCKDTLPFKPPTPVLSEPAPAGTTTNPLVALNWFCPTSGVYRFEVRVQRADQPGSGKPTGFINNQLTKLSVFKSMPEFLYTNPIPPPPPRFYGLTHFRKLASTYDEWQLTPPIIGTNFGPGPQFKLTASVVPGVPYHIAVAAENIQGYWGDSSTEWTFMWQPPPKFLTVPWPARPLPPVTQFDEPAKVPQPFPAIMAPRVAALVFTNATGGIADGRYPVGIRFAMVSGIRESYNIGTTNFGAYLNFAGTDPNSGIFARYADGNGALQNGDPLLPMMVYRKQETNANFPRVSGNVTQVTPLLERVPWLNRGLFTVIPDRLIALGYETFNTGGDAGQFFSGDFLYVRDEQPVILGARYHYYVVRFNGGSTAPQEVAEIIDAGAVDIPAQ
jgi:hypothetical protein